MYQVPTSDRNLGPCPASVCIHIRLFAGGSRYTAQTDDPPPNRVSPGVQNRFTTLIRLRTRYPTFLHLLTLFAQPATTSDIWTGLTPRFVYREV